jgi:peptidoglycan-N-acetylglucosamine deacetylase
MRAASVFDGKELQLTFDDGPLTEHEALDPILAEIPKRKVVVAFFVLDREVEQKPAAAKKISDAKNVLGNHSWNHLEKKTSDYTDQQPEIELGSRQPAAAAPQRPRKALCLGVQLPR